MQLRSSLLLAAVALTTPPAQAVGSKVNLFYARYNGTVLSNGITQWLGMRYAAPPIGRRRFRHPHDPEYELDVQSAQVHRDLCLVTGNPVGDPGHSEDCLFINVQAPSNAETSSKLPVLVYISGDGYNSTLPDSNQNATHLLEDNANNFVVVTFNYRVGPYGFLTKGDFLATNNGIRDQLKALDWVTTNIHRFGGNPKHVVIGGSGIGAQNVLIHFTMQEMNNPRFQGVIAESPSFPPMLHSDAAGERYREFAKQVGCDDNIDSDPLSRAQMEDGQDSSLECMFRLTADDIQAASRNATMSSIKAPPWDPWLPLIDNDVIFDTISNNFESGHYAVIPFVMGNIVNYRHDFAYRNGAITQDAAEYMHDLYPNLIPLDLVKIDRLYPEHNSSYRPRDRLISNAHHDARFTCPTLTATKTMKRHGLDLSWLYLWQVDEWHITDTHRRQDVQAAALWGRPNTRIFYQYEEDGENESVPFIKQRYWTNFVKSLNPNRDADVRDPKGSMQAGENTVRLKIWRGWSRIYRRHLVFKNEGELEFKNTDYLEKRCKFWNAMRRRMRI